MNDIVNIAVAMNRLYTGVCKTAQFVKNPASHYVLENGKLQFQTKDGQYRSVSHRDLDTGYEVTKYMERQSELICE